MIVMIGAAWFAISAWATANWLRAIRKLPAARLVWTLGAAALIVHVLLAFHLVRAWDLAAAERAVARETYERTGLDWRGGIYFNYAFAGLWLLDTTCWWLARRRYEARPRRFDGAVQLVFLFMFVNATVIFGVDHARAPGVVLCGLGTAGWIVGSRRGSATPPRASFQQSSECKYFTQNHQASSPRQR